MTRSCTPYKLRSLLNKIYASSARTRRRPQTSLRAFRSQIAPPLMRAALWWLRRKSRIQSYPSHCHCLRATARAQSLTQSSTIALICCSQWARSSSFLKTLSRSRKKRNRRRGRRRKKRRRKFQSDNSDRSRARSLLLRISMTSIQAATSTLL